METLQCNISIYHDGATSPSLFMEDKLITFCPEHRYFQYLDKNNRIVTRFLSEKDDVVITPKYLIVREDIIRCLKYLCTYQGEGAISEYKLTDDIESCVRQYADLRGYFDLSDAIDDLTRFILKYDYPHDEHEVIVGGYSKGEVYSKRFSEIMSKKV